MQFVTYNDRQIVTALGKWKIFSLDKLIDRVAQKLWTNLQYFMEKTVNKWYHALKIDFKRKSKFEDCISI